jgi:hypothetical protein
MGTTMVFFLILTELNTDIVNRPGPITSGRKIAPRRTGLQHVYLFRFGFMVVADGLVLRLLLSQRDPHGPLVLQFRGDCPQMSKSGAS